MTFLTTPYPERIYNVSIAGEKMVFGTSLSVGLQIIDKDAKGLNVVPTPSVAFAIGDQENLERSKATITIAMARALAARIVEFCDAGDKIANG